MGARKVLPIAEPDITSYAHFSYSLSVMHTDELYLDWVYSNFIQLNLQDRTSYIFLDYFSPTITDYPIPGFYGKSHLNRNMILRNYERFGDFLRESIDDGRYISTYVDDYYVPGTVAYQNRSNPHGILVYGYDDDNRHFLITGYLANQTYGHTTVDYDNIESAFKAIQLTDESDYHNFTHVFKLNPKYGYDFNLQWVMEQLEDYTYGKSSMWRWEGIQGKDHMERSWGIGIYDELVRKIKEQMEGDFILDHRPIYVLWEHKRMMNKRIAYMENRGYFVSSQEVKEGYARLERMAATSRHQILKYWMTKDNRRLEELIKQLYQLKSEETLINERLLQEYRSQANG